MSTVPAVAQRPSLGLTGLMRRHPLPAYFVIAFLGTWLLDLPIVLGQDGLGLLAYHVPFALYVILFLAGSYAGPTLAAFWVTDALEGRSGRRRFLHRYVQWRVGVLPYLVVLFAYPLIWLAAQAITGGPGSLGTLPARWAAYFTTYLPAILIFPAFITWGEEPGWRGFALTRMQAGYSPLVAAAVVGLMHGLWHFPVFLLVSGPPALGPFSLMRFALNTAGIFFVSVAFAWVFNRARQSILIAVLIHASFNAAPAWLAQSVPSLGHNIGYVALALYVSIALVIIVATKGRLGYRRPVAMPVTAEPSDGGSDASLPGAYSDAAAEAGEPA